MVKKETREEWRKLAKEAMHSWIGEYCPKDEFFALLDYIDELEDAQQSVKRIGGTSTADKVVRQMAESLIKFVDGDPTNR